MILGGMLGGMGLPVFAVHTWAAWQYARVSLTSLLTDDVSIIVQANSAAVILPSRTALSMAELIIYLG